MTAAARGSPRPKISPRRQPHPRGPQGSQYFSALQPISLSDIGQANILMTNDTPPRACLADFGFMTMVLDPNHPMSCSAQLEGGTMTFMAPELVAPTKFGLKESTPTRQADIYAFGLVIFQVYEEDHGCRLSTYIFQVLTGEIPFRGFGSIGFAYSVVEGLRPDKPEKALAIGFSDSLWAFVQRCWDGNMDLRPKVPELVTHLEKAAADWNGVMPPCIQAKYVTPDSGESMSDWMKHREFEILTLSVTFTK